jgi:hypothetical protein
MRNHSFEISRFPRIKVSICLSFEVSWFQGFRVSGFQGCLEVRSNKKSSFQGFRVLRLPRTKVSLFQVSVAVRNQDFEVFRNKSFNVFRFLGLKKSRIQDFWFQRIYF